MFKKTSTVGVATAIAHPNIAFIKYWGNRDNELRLPANGSISMNLDGLTTRTTVRFETRLKNDTFILNQKIQGGKALQRVSAFLDIVRKKANFNYFAEVVSENNFPTGSGLASSAAAFAALSLAATKAAGLNLNRQELSALARRGSGSACRSIPAGFVEWLPGSEDEDSYAISIAPPNHWELIDCIAIVESDHKSIGSTEGHQLAATSPLQAARVEDAPRRLDICRRAILQKDFEALAQIVELDSNLMHAVMMTSTPPLFYWNPASIDLMKKVRDWRDAGLPVCYTLDAGPNVHMICLNEALNEVKFRLQQIPAVEQVLVCRPGGAATVLE
ncbi:diphosphomevalonate decarboxylase [Bellilinea caldifistulae]|uniref:diphosphomevalonate decarboxylase n=1 Tax=Bellilinea caldifistulae TaxID=360411 RepID=A0A0P6X2Q3_9CHLR|nr:diphosphomevalonate decarboxylase [Bellilinea caldifistulae]KPL73960.1 hypothetical protein AC812_14455 [Bellilinea caldifistulae]GAP11270.1 diphosphomevalonate decarboxylase [Bellilinea caldifistulae]